MNKRTQHTFSLGALLASAILFSITLFIYNLIDAEVALILSVVTCSLAMIAVVLRKFELKRKILFFIWFYPFTLSLGILWIGFIGKLLTEYFLKQLKISYMLLTFICLATSSFLFKKISTKKKENIPAV